MGRELEWKFQASEDVLLGLENKFGVQGVVEMETVYYDTQDLKLSFHQWTLRRRLENGVSVCTFKKPLEDGSRGEWEVEAGSIMDGVMALCQAGAPWELMRACAGGVYPLCGARFTRKWTVIDLGDATVELALDSGVLTGRGKEMPLCEAEVEWKSGSEASAREFAMGLGLEAEALSKFARARARALG